MNGNEGAVRAEMNGAAEAWTSGGRKQRERCNGH